MILCLACHPPECRKNHTTGPGTCSKCGVEGGGVVACSGTFGQTVANPPLPDSIRSAATSTAPATTPHKHTPASRTYPESASRIVALAHALKAEGDVLSYAVLVLCAAAIRIKAEPELLTVLAEMVEPVVGKKQNSQSVNTPP